MSDRGNSPIHRCDACGLDLDDCECGFFHPSDSLWDDPELDAEEMDMPPDALD